MKLPADWAAYLAKAEKYMVGHFFGGTLQNILGPFDTLAQANNAKETASKHHSGGTISHFVTWIVEEAVKKELIDHPEWRALYEELDRRVNPHEAPKPGQTERRRIPNAPLSPSSLPPQKPQTPLGAEASASPETSKPQGAV